MSAPSVGRIVHYHDRDVGPCAAIITACEKKRRDSPLGLAIHDENSYDVRVTVFYPGVTKPMDVVPYGIEAGQWSWPPRVP